MDIQGKNISGLMSAIAITVAKPVTKTVPKPK
jgi:hypothetical protein